MKYLTICILCLMAMLSTQSIVYAQNTETKSSFSPKLIAKYSLFSLMEPETTIQLGVEYIFKPKIAFQQQFGYIFNNPLGHNIGGIRSRSEMRFYYTKDKRIQGYVAPEVLYKFVQQNGIREFWREEGAYRQTIDFEANRNVIGFMPKVGLTNDIFNSTFALDFAFGIGVKAIYYKSNVPGDAIERNDISFTGNTFFNNRLRNSGHEVLPNLYFGLLLGFVAK